MIDVICSHNEHIKKSQAAKLILFSLRIDVDLPLIKLRELSSNNIITGNYEKCIITILKQAEVHGGVTLALEKIYGLSDDELRHSEKLQQLMYQRFYEEYFKILYNREYNNDSYVEKKSLVIRRLIEEFEIDADCKIELINSALELMGY